MKKRRLIDSSGVRYEYPVPLDIMFILFVNFYNATKDEDIGFADCNSSIDKVHDLMTKGRAIQLERSDLEALLWSANMMEEKGDFWHPDEGARLTDIINRLLTNNEDFDYYYNLIVGRKEHDNDTR